MFRRKLKIKAIAMAAAGDYIFTFGVGNDNNIYSWNSTTGQWQPHIVAPPAPEAK